MIIISVSGKPAPQGSKTRNRAGAVYESSKAVGPWRDAVRTETQAIVRAMAGPPYLSGEPVEVSILVRLARPAGHFGSGRNAGNLRATAPPRPRTTPDIDKLARAILDGITAGGAIADDSQIADLRVSKVYCDRGEAPGADVRVELAAVAPAVERRLFSAGAAAFGEFGEQHVRDACMSCNVCGAPDHVADLHRDPETGLIGYPLLPRSARESLEQASQALARINGR